MLMCANDGYGEENLGFRECTKNIHKGSQLT